MFDFEPPPSQRPQPSLDLMSIEELEEKIAALEREIFACRAAIDAKRAQRAAADSLFSGRRD